MLDSILSVWANSTVPIMRCWCYREPVRLFQQFATVDLLSEGRPELLAGRGSFIESFPLFGYVLGGYDALFSEKLDLFLPIREAEIISWTPVTCGHRSMSAAFYPCPQQQQKSPIWIAVGDNPELVPPAGHGLPVALAIIGGEYRRFAPLFDLYREAARRAGMTSRY